MLTKRLPCHRGFGQARCWSRCKNGLPVPLTRTIDDKSSKAVGGYLSASNGRSDPARPLLDRRRYGGQNCARRGKPSPPHLRRNIRADARRRRQRRRPCSQSMLLFAARTAITTRQTARQFRMTCVRPSWLAIRASPAGTSATFALRVGIASVGDRLSVATGKGDVARLASA